MCLAFILNMDVVDVTELFFIISRTAEWFGLDYYCVLGGFHRMAHFLEDPDDALAISSSVGQ